MLTHKPTEKKESKLKMGWKPNKNNGLQGWKTEHQAVINSTLSGRHDPAMSECWTTPAGLSAMYFKLEIVYFKT